ncbi:MAG: RNA polymerase sigma factor [Acidobacteria bacterium]|nr:RNA polymerase sigma factor [Acidobacteriota bacterium]
MRTHVSETSDTLHFTPSQSAASGHWDGAKELPQCFLARMKAGDADAFSNLYQIYHRRVFGIILKIVENPDIAEDLAQESFLKLWRSASNLKLEYDLVGPWLMRVARNCALDYRKSTISFRIEQIVPDQATSSGLAEQTAVWKRHRLQQAFLQLPPEQKDVILLSFFQGLSQSEIAERLGQPLGTIKGRVRLGLAKLRSAMEGNESPQDPARMR